MKVLTRNARALLSTGLTAAVMLLSSPAMALGTDAGVVVSNQASVDYEVNGQNQPDIPSTDVNAVAGSGDPTTFVVDRRVDFTFVEIAPLGHTDIQPGETNAFAAFLLTNESNATMDFILDLIDLAPGDPAVHGQPDSGNPLAGNFQIRVANTDGPAGVPDLADLDWVDELVEDQSVVIYVFASAGATLPNDVYDNFSLTASAADTLDASPNPGNRDPLLTESPAGVDNPTVIENVFANDSGADATTGYASETVDDGFRVTSAQLVITKSAAVISDDFGSGKALPNAVVEYTVTLDNTAGNEPADNVVMTDVIQTPDVALELGGYGGDDVAIDGVGCTAAADADGCTYDGGTDTLTVTIPTIADGATVTVTYRVRISPL